MNVDCTLLYLNLIKNLTCLNQYSNIVLIYVFAIRRYNTWGFFQASFNIMFLDAITFICLCSYSNNTLISFLL